MLSDCFVFRLLDRLKNAAFILPDVKHTDAVTILLAPSLGVKLLATWGRGRAVISLHRSVVKPFLSACFIVATAPGGACTTDVAQKIPPACK